jgi:hypothetical protein
MFVELSIERNALDRNNPKPEKRNEWLMTTASRQTCRQEHQQAFYLASPKKEKIG